MGIPILGSLPQFAKEWIVLTGFIFITTFLFYYFFKDKKFLKYGVVCFLILTTCYFSFNVWIFALILMIILLKFTSKKSDLEKVGYFLLLFPLIPLFSWIIPLPGDIIQLFTLNYQLILTLIILLPLFFKYLYKKKIKLNKVDLLILLFLIYTFFMNFRDTTFTNAIRAGVFGHFGIISVFIPYFVITRTITKKEDFKELFWPMVFVATFLAFIGIFETLKHWHLYSSFAGVTIGSYFKARGGFYRSTGTFGGPIQFGMYFVLMTAYLLFLKYFDKNKKFVSYNLLMSLLFIAMLSTFSRGPLLGYVVFFGLLFMLSISKMFRYIPLFLILILSIFILPFGDTIISTLPFIGEKDQGTIDYRERVWENSIEVIKEKPLTGSNDYLEHPKMQELRQGQGIIDILSFFIQITLRCGLLGFLLYSLIFISIFFSLFKKLFITKDILNKILFSIFIAVLVIINTTSAGSLFPYYVWMLIAFCSRYINLTNEEKNRK